MMGGVPGAGGGGGSSAGAMRIAMAMGGQGGDPSGGSMAMPMAFPMGGGQQFSEKDLENAKLPEPPEEGSQLDVLLRPGLLADVEIIVEKVPNVIHIPAQAVFEKDGKPVVFVKRGDQYEERLIQPLKRSESTMVISEGLKAGELVALANPTATKDKKAKDASKKAAAPAPAGGGGGGR
jgi:hypothetical protein